MPRKFKNTSRKGIDWALLVLIAGAVIFLIAGLPKRGVSGVVEVLDGDSIILNTEEIRLFGIDAPEGKQSCHRSNGSLYQCGRDATRALRSLVDGKNVACNVLSNDRYGRSIAHCTVNLKSINEEMVRQGWAVAYRTHTAGYTDAESDARQAKRGIWQGRFERPESWRHSRASLAGVNVEEAPDD